MENCNRAFKEMDRGFISKLNLEFKLSYLLTDIIFKNSERTSYPRLRVVKYKPGTSI